MFAVIVNEPKEFTLEFARVLRRVNFACGCSYEESQGAQGPRQHIHTCNEHYVNRLAVADVARQHLADQSNTAHNWAI
jgi:hypothetical protein